MSEKKKGPVCPHTNRALSKNNDLHVLTCNQCDVVLAREVHEVDEIVAVSNISDDYKMRLLKHPRYPLPDPEPESDE